jgi:transmembrane sensor
VAFDDTPLADAVAEMNRYSAVRLIVKDSGTAGIRISGVFRAGDSANFARALERTYQLQVRQDMHEVTLSGGAAQPPLQ